MVNPCWKCKKANLDDVRDLEYGCEKPCRKARKYVKKLCHKLDELLIRVKRLLDKGE